MFLVFGFGKGVFSCVVTGFFFIGFIGVLVSWGWDLVVMFVFRLMGGFGIGYYVFVEGFRINLEWSLIFGFDIVR